MNDRIVETYYGPEIRAQDWVAHNAEVREADGGLRVSAEGNGCIANRFYPFDGGGDVALTVGFTPVRVRDDSRIELRFNDPFGWKQPLWEPRNPPFVFRLSPAAAELEYRGERVGHKDLAPGGFGRAHTVLLTTLADVYRFVWNDEVLAEGRMARPVNDNEGMFALSLENVDLALSAFQEDFIAHPVDIPAWKRTELLYEESFGDDSWRQNWACNGKSPDVDENGFIFRHMSNNLLRQRFDGPIAVESIATPVPTEEFSAGVTDAIFLWMVHKPDGDLMEYLANLPDASLGNLMPLSLYWVDMGGTNNKTTRLRKNPHRQMVRQFIDPPRLLERDRTYRITLVQNGHFIEYWVDGEPWIRFYDPEPIVSGHVGFRAFCADLQVTGVQVWRIG